MVIYFNPQITSSTVNLVEPAEPAEPIALNYLELTDGGKISLSWNAMDPDLRSLSFDSLEVMEKMYGSFRAPLGNIIIRKTVGVQSVQSPAGFPVGLYRGVSYITHFSSDNECRMEYVVLRATQDLVWKVASYSITPYLVHCS
nr:MULTISPECIES: DUF4019 domain-containing protein [Pseudomonas]